ncbi:FRG domain-containing protein [Streptococcus cristatus]|uniref:FRG domain-containing protein n=1 Tax=Streptococcus cristatus TaxID=45634 RepID=UPI0028D81E49|nr:FRG domain-containing protein [Streptococcus cristatus]
MSGETEIKFENEIECDSVNSILELILNQERNETDNDSANRVRKNLFFRGEDSNHELRTPSLYLQEGLTLEGSEYYYRMLLSELGRDDYQENSSLVRLISELQHYGAKTRVLDITSNPLIALYFAVEKKDDKSGYVFIYKSDEENEKFDTGHTIAIKSALNLIPQKIINNFLKAVNFICKDESELEKLENVPLENLNYLLGEKLRERNQELYKVKIRELEAPIVKLMELLNQRARVRERLNLPFKIAMDLGKAHIVIPSKTTDRIRQQQGAFIYPKFTDTSDKTHEEVKKEISESINHFNATLKIQKEDKTCLLSVIRIDGNNKKKIRSQLKLLGITEGFVYPDIEHKSNALLGISQNGNKTAQNKSN